MVRVLFFYLGLVLLSMPFFSSCTPRDRAKDVVSVSIAPQAFFVNRLSGGLIEVNVMIPPGASHSTYSPTPRQYKKLSDSRLYIGIGHLGYEQAWMPRLGELNPDMYLLDLSSKTSLIAGGCGPHHDHGHHDHVHGVDPHTWMSPAVMLELLPHVKSALIDHFPEYRDTIENNYPALLSEIHNVHEKMKAVTSVLDFRKFLIFHPALTYLARDYGLEQIAIEQDGKEPSPAFLASVIQRAREEGIPVIFVQQEYDKRSAQQVSQEVGIDLVQINPLAYDWIASMHQLIEDINYHLNE